MKNIILAVAVFWLFSSAVMAGGWVGWTTVEQVYVSDNGAINTKFGLMENPGGCSSISWIQTSSSNGASKEILSILLAALAANKEVRYYRSGCGTYPIMRHVMLRREPD